MYNWFWRMVLIFRHKRMLKTGDPSYIRLGTTFIVTIFVLTPVLLGLGFGYLSWMHASRLSEQITVDLRGITTTARIEMLFIEEVKHTTSKTNIDRRPPPPSYFCNLQVIYSAPRQDYALSKRFRLEDDSVCRRYAAGDDISGKVLADSPSVFVLNEGRLAVHWFVISFSLFALFTLFPLALLLRSLLKRLSKPKRLALKKTS